MNKYKELKIWQKSIVLVEEIYHLMSKLPSDEKFGLISQIKRCSVSIPSNIAEGAGRNSKKEFIHFLSVSNGSLSELETQLILVYRLNFANKNLIEPLLEKCNEIKKMNFALQKSLI